MAVTTQTVILEFDADTGAVLKATGQLEKSMDNVAASAESAAEATEEIGESAKKSGSGLSKMGKLGSSAFKAVGTAIKATGIGLLVGLVAQLVMKFAENKKIADTLQVALAGLGAAFNIIIDGATWVIDNLVDAFKNPQEAIEGLKQKLQAVGDYIGTLVDTALNPLQRGLLNMKRGFLEAAAGAKEFFGGDATELKKQIREVDDELSDLVKQQEENKETLAEPFNDLAEAVNNYVEETVKAVQASTELEKKLQGLRDAQRDNDVAFAQATAQLEELKKTRDDERLSIEERIAAAEKAQAMEKQFTDERIRLANQTVTALEEEIRLQGATEERLQEVADARIAAADAAAASAAVQTEFMTSIYALEQEAIATEQEVAALRRELRGEVLEGYAAEKQAIEDQLEDRVAAIGQLKITEEEKTQLVLEATASRDQQLEQLEVSHQAELLAIQEAADAEAAAKQKELDDAERARRDKELADAQALAQAKLDVAKSSLDALSALNAAFTGESEAEQKKGFERSKKIQTAQALISTYESAVQAFKSLAGIPVVGPGLGAAAAAAATAAGLANVKQIQSQQYQSAGGGGGGSSYSSAGTAGQAAQAAQQTPSAPVLDLGFLGAGSQQQVIETYVISENVTNAQQANKKIQDQATL